MLKMSVEGMFQGTLVSCQSHDLSVRVLVFSIYVLEYVLEKLLMHFRGTSKNPFMPISFLHPYATQVQTN